MRAIRTELYFGEDAIKSDVRRPRFHSPRSYGKNDGIAFLWFGNDEPGPYNIENYKWFDGQKIEIENINIAIDLLLEDVNGREIRRSLSYQGKFRNESLIEFILDQEIVIEQSPPTAVRLKDLLKRTNAPLLIGAYMGRAIAGDSPALLFITIPCGIIIVGSALGIADAMADGLHKWIKELFDSHRKKG